jgi:hypothetical protein
MMLKTARCQRPWKLALPETDLKGNTSTSIKHSDSVSESHCVQQALFTRTWRRPHCWSRKVEKWKESSRKSPLGFIVYLFIFHLLKGKKVLPFILFWPFLQSLCFLRFVVSRIFLWVNLFTYHLAQNYCIHTHVSGSGYVVTLRQWHVFVISFGVLITILLHITNHTLKNKFSLFCPQKYSIIPLFSSP